MNAGGSVRVSGGNVGIAAVMLAGGNAADRDVACGSDNEVAGIGVGVQLHVGQFDGSAGICDGHAAVTDGGVNGQITGSGAVDDQIAGFQYRCTDECGVDHQSWQGGGGESDAGGLQDQFRRVRQRLPGDGTFSRQDQVSGWYGGQLPDRQAGRHITGRLCNQSHGTVGGRATGVDAGGVQIAEGRDVDSAVRGGRLHAYIGEAVYANITGLAGMCCDAGCAGPAADAQLCGGGNERSFKVSAGAMAETAGGGSQSNGLTGGECGTGECQISCGGAGIECDVSNFRSGGQICER